MYRDHGSFLTAKGSAYVGRWLRTMLQGLSLMCVALSVVSCVAQQADLVRLETEFRSKMAKLDREKEVIARTIEEAKQAITDSKEEVLNNLGESRAKIRNELRKLREERLPHLYGEMETTVRRVDQLRDALDEESGRLQQRDKIVGEQFADFRDSLVRFKETLVQVDAQLTEEQNRAMDAERAMQHAFTRHHDALREKLDLDTQALKAYLATDVHKTIEEINKVLGTNEHVLSDKLDAQGTQLSEVRTRLDNELTALQGYAERMNQVVEQLRNDVQNMRAGLESGGDDPESRRIELPTVPGSSR